MNKKVFYKKYETYQRMAESLEMLFSTACICESHFQHQKHRMVHLFSPPETINYSSKVKLSGKDLLWATVVMVQATYGPLPSCYGPLCSYGPVHIWATF